MAASFAQPNDVLVDPGTGYQLPLNGNGTTDTQTYTVTSSNPKIGATVAQGQFFTIGVTHTAADANDISFSGTIVLQLFQDLTPLTVSRISELVNEGFYLQPTAQNNPSTGQPFPTKNWHRIASGFPGATDFIVQGGSVNGDGTGDVNQPGFPFADEFVPQLSYNGTGQLGMANTGPNTTSNSSQFFITTGSPTFLNNRNTIFGQVVSGMDVVDKMTQVETTGSPQTTPVSPILFTQASLSDTNPNGVIHIDATNASAGDSTTLTITATDTKTGEKVTRVMHAYVPGSTGAVRILSDTRNNVTSNVLIATPKPRRDHGRNTITINEFQGNVYAVVNGVADTTQVASSSITKIIAYGSKNGDTITVSPNVLEDATIDGGHGGFNVLQGGDGQNRMHGWFGYNVMRGGPQRDFLIGRKGRVKFRFSPGDDLYFVGEPRLTIQYKHHKAVAPFGQVVTVLPPVATQAAAGKARHKTAHHAKG
jgi:cyclophilin family peptidyl-prolyl cis-trans isomerase